MADTNDLPTDVDELQVQLAIARAELEDLRPARLRETIRAAGYDPDSSAGKVLTKLAADDDSLARSPGAMRTAARELDLDKPAEAPAPQAAPQPAPQPQPTNYGDHLNDPAFPASHPRNDPNDVAFRIARRERERQEKSAQTYAAMLAADENGRQPGEFHPGDQKANVPVKNPAKEPERPRGWVRMEEGRAKAFKEKNAALLKGMMSQG